MRYVRLGFLVALVLALTSTLPAVAAHKTGHIAPQKAAKISFGPEFPSLTDNEWNFALGGFGGAGKLTALRHIPAIFVHGNNVDACDWYPVRAEFRKAGWTDQEFFALSYNGLGGNNGSGAVYLNPDCNAEHSAMGYDGTTRVTENEVNIPDLYEFVLAVRQYTGVSKFSIVSHSLGVTLARKVLKVHPELRKDLVAFVGIAGGNHGTSFCPPGSETLVESCNEIAANTPWLADLNGTNGDDETYAPARWMTVYDGSGAGDPAYVGPTYAQSPALKGADNRQFAATYHNDLRLSPAIIAVYRAFLESSETPVLAQVPPALRSPELQKRVLAATGAPPWLLYGFGLLALGIVFGLAGRAKSDRKRGTA